MFQVYPLVSKDSENDSDEVEVDIRGSFVQHISMLEILFKIRNKAATDELVSIYEDIVWDFFTDFGIWKEDASIDITSLPNEAYPTCTDFMNYLEKVEETIDEERKGYLQK